MLVVCCKWYVLVCRNIRHALGTSYLVLYICSFYIFSESPAAFLLTYQHIPAHVILFLAILFPKYCTRGYYRHNFQGVRNFFFKRVVVFLCAGLRTYRIILLFDDYWLWILVETIEFFVYASSFFCVILATLRSVKEKWINAIFFY